MSAEPQVCSTVGDADAGAEVLRIGRDGEQGVGSGLEQDAVYHRLVVVGDVGDLLGQREQHVEIRHGKQVGLARAEPFPRCPA